MTINLSVETLWAAFGLGSFASGVAVALVIVLILTPPRYDPAIRLKEWMENREKGGGR